MLHNLSTIDPNTLTSTCALLFTIFVALLVLVLLIVRGPPNDTGEGGMTP